MNDKLKRTTGKKVYGYLKPEVKFIVNQIVDELEKNESIKALYDLWYEQKDKITSNYTSEKTKRIPLSANKEFKSIRNMVIKEALKLDELVLIFDDESTEEPIVLSAPETEPEPDDDELDYRDYMITSSEKYRKAKRLNIFEHYLPHKDKECFENKIKNIQRDMYEVERLFGNNQTRMNDILKQDVESLYKLACDSLRIASHIELEQTTNFSEEQERGDAVWGIQQA